MLVPWVWNDILRLHAIIHMVSFIMFHHSLSSSSVSTVACHHASALVVEGKRQDPSKWLGIVGFWIQMNSHYVSPICLHVHRSPLIICACPIFVHNCTWFWCSHMIRNDFIIMLCPRVPLTSQNPQQVVGLQPSWAWISCNIFSNLLIDLHPVAMLRARWQ